MTEKIRPPVQPTETNQDRVTNAGKGILGAMGAVEHEIEAVREGRKARWKEAVTLKQPQSLPNVGKIDKIRQLHEGGARPWDVLKEFPDAVGILVDMGLNPETNRRQQIIIGRLSPEKLKELSESNPGVDFSGSYMSEMGGFGPNADGLRFEPGDELIGLIKNDPGSAKFGAQTYVTDPRYGRSTVESITMLMHSPVQAI